MELALTMFVLFWSQGWKFNFDNAFTLLSGQVTYSVTVPFNFEFAPIKSYKLIANPIMLIAMIASFIAKQSLQ